MAMTSPVSVSHILCPVDFSEPSAHAIANAAVVADWYRSKVTILHVPPPFAANAPEDDRCIERLRANVGSFAAATGPSLRNADVLVAAGEPAQRIVRTAADLAADLIVMGTHGTSGFEHVLLGSVTEKVLRKATCPVLTVPPRMHATSRLPFARILCPVDLSESSLSAVEWTWSLAQESQAAVSLLHVIEWPWNEPPAPDLEELPPHEAEKLSEFRRFMETTWQARLDRLVPHNVREGGESTTLVKHGKAHRQVLATAEAVGADLIVMGVRGRDPIDMTLFGSTTNQVVRQASCPVLTVRTKR